MEIFERQLTTIMRTLVLNIESLLEESELDPYVASEIARELNGILDQHHESVTAAAHSIQP